MIRVHDIMTPGVVTVTVDTSVARAIELMREHELHFLPVLLEDVCAGALTSRDVEIKVLQAGRDADTTAVADVMSRGLSMHARHDAGANEPLATISDEATPEEALQRCDELGVRRLVVHDSDYAIVGIVSRSDLEAAGVVGADSR